MIFRDRLNVDSLCVCNAYSKLQQSIYFAVLLELQGSEGWLVQMTSQSALVINMLNVVNQLK